MALDLSAPDVGRLGAVVEALRTWQSDDGPLQLHPGDLGWHWRFGADAMAAALRVWSRDDRILAVGFLDGPDVLRLTVASDVRSDEDVARRIVADLCDPDLGVLPAGEASVEAPDGTRVQSLLDDAGWATGLPWTPLRLGLAERVEPTALTAEVVRPGSVSEFTAVHRSAWGSERFTDELWRTMAGGVPFADARCVLGRDAGGVPVAGVTVWSAGPGRPGLLEPMGVHADHRGHGYGTMICREAAAELQRMGASSAEVCTLSSLTGAVATYRAAGFAPLPERLDRTRAARD